MRCVGTRDKPRKSPWTWAAPKNAAHLFELITPVPVEARYVRFKVTPERTLTVSEVEVLDFIKYEPFALRLALPDEPLAARVQ